MEINVGYAWGELQAALETAAKHPDADVRARAEQNVERWREAIAGMQRGAIQVGSRTPTEAPAWVTLDVATGGFATGRYLAGGPLLPHELKLAQDLHLPPARLALNLHFLEAPQTLEMFLSGCYRIEVPEEGALLVVCWLRETGELAAAGELVNALSPWFSELRFYPRPAAYPLKNAATVRLQDLRATVAQVTEPRRQPRFEEMRRALQVWTPLADRALALLLATVEGEPPRLVDGKVAGGDIARHFPEGWALQVAALVADRRRAGKADTARAEETSARIDLLARCAADPTSLAPRELHQLRRALARHLTAHEAHGLPGTAEHAAWRAEQARAVAAPLHADLRLVIAERLRPQPLDGGLPFETAAAPISSDESVRFELPAGSELPDYLVDKLARSWDAPLEQLVERGVIPSSESLAAVLPQLTARVRAETLPDELVRTLYSALYGAFRKRRGLLLVNYQQQVRFEELPWAAALEKTRRTDDEATARAHAIVAQASATAIKAFPHTILPNPLVTELSALSTAADLKMPLVEELAADIFMGSFTGKFAHAARIAGRLLEGSLYQRYYAISPSELRGLPYQDRLSSQLAGMCATRAARINGDAGRGVARNGKIIEQSQILTTHNLAVLFDELSLREPLAGELRALAETCLRWITRQLTIPPRSGHEVLLRLKNTAYAWRQMIFYLSFVADLPDFLRWARDQLTRAPKKFRRRFEPALRGLELAAAGHSSASREFTAGGGRVFTGWATERHWLSPPPPGAEEEAAP
jgi:hypothetical protein